MSIPPPGDNTDPHLVVQLVRLLGLTSQTCDNLDKLMQVVCIQHNQILSLEEKVAKLERKVEQ